jgi:hypothetical protein
MNDMKHGQEFKVKTYRGEKSVPAGMVYFCGGFTELGAFYSPEDFQTNPLTDFGWYEIATLPKEGWRKIEHVISAEFYSECDITILFGKFMAEDWGGNMFARSSFVAIRSLQYKELQEVKK